MVSAGLVTGVVLGAVLLRRWQDRSPRLLLGRLERAAQRLDRHVQRFSVS